MEILVYQQGRSCRGYSLLRLIGVDGLNVCSVSQELSVGSQYSLLRLVGVGGLHSCSVSRDLSVGSGLLDRVCSQLFCDRLLRLLIFALDIMLGLLDLVSRRIILVLQTQD
jgi:hypothetical protein